MVSGEVLTLLKEMVHKVLCAFIFYCVIETDAREMSQNSTQQTTSDEEAAKQLHEKLNGKPSRSARAKASPERFGDFATTKEVMRALNDGQGTSAGFEWNTKDGKPRIY